MFYKKVSMLEKYKQKINYSKPIEAMFTNYLERLDALKDPSLDLEKALDQIRDHLLIQNKYQRADLAYGDEYQNEVLELFINFDARLREQKQDTAFLYSPGMLFFAVYDKHWNSVYYEAYTIIFDMYEKLIKIPENLPVFYDNVFNDKLDSVLSYAVDLQKDQNAKALILTRLKKICDMLA
jgi:hypothetical protein